MRISCVLKGLRFKEERRMSVIRDFGDCLIKPNETGETGETMSHYEPFSFSRPESTRKR